MNPHVQTLAAILADPVRYTRETSGIALRPYQCAPIPRILESIQNHDGDTLILVFPRQSGKDELLVHLKLHLFDIYSPAPVSMVEVNPTYDPQTTYAMNRFDTALDRNPFTRGRWRKRGQFMRLLDRARLTFLSGDASSNVLGATASLLLIINEAQDLDPNHYHKKFLPMTASTNATRLLAGTIWNSTTLLSQEIRLARQQTARDGRQRVFMVDAEAVRAVHPDYGRAVDAEIARLGRDHPIVKTQYFNEELDAHSAIFTPLRFAQMRPDRPPQDSPLPGALYAFLLDVAGQDEAIMLDPFAAPSNPGRDSVALSIVDVDLSTLETKNLPTYRVVHRESWLGESHLRVFDALQGLIELWHPDHVVMDATGVGEGLRAMLENGRGYKLHAVKYTTQIKSQIGYNFLGILGSNRFKDCAPDPKVRAQYENCQAETLPGPAKLMRWFVPDNKRGPDGKLIHDDALMADSLVTFLDGLEWYPTMSYSTIDPPDLSWIDRNF